MVDDLAPLRASIRSRPAQQQPTWPNPAAVAQASKELETKPALVRGEDVRTLRALLARVAAGQLQVAQAGDCAEDPDECTPGYVARKAALLDVLAGIMKMISHKPVVRVGRMAGQFAKPRSQPTELFRGVELPAYRGHLVNSPEPDPELRRPDPRRLLSGYHAASDAMHHLGWWDLARHCRVEPPVWTSHEALLLDYELPMLRRDDEGRPLLTSTHWPWVGRRTSQVDGAHMALLAEVANPVSCKVPHDMRPDELTAICERLDPARVPGRLTLIARMGSGTVADCLPPLVSAVRTAGHPVTWMCDPMHANTVNTSDGLKTRYLERIIREVEDFHQAVYAAGGIASGLHLETTPDLVTECVLNEKMVDEVRTKYTSACDPRLNPHQAITVVSTWRG